MLKVSDYKEIMEQDVVRVYDVLKVWMEKICFMKLKNLIVDSLDMWGVDMSKVDFLKMKFLELADSCEEKLI